MNRLAARTPLVFLSALALCEIASIAAFLAASNYSPATLNDPARLVAVGNGGADLLRVGAQLDMFGYLFAIPLALYLRARFAAEPWIDLFTLAGILALTLGALGAVAFAYGGVPLVHEYASAAKAAKQSIVTTFATVYWVVFFGIWQVLDAALAAVWLVGTGRLAWKHGARTLASALIAFGIVGAAVATAHVTAIFPGS